MKNKKIIVVFIVFAVLIAGSFYYITTSTLNSENDANKNTASTEETVSEAKAKANAQKLIGETLTQDEVKEKLGDWSNFEMSSEGCERGVYAGRFFYNDFTIFSKTYDKVQTYQIESINEK